MGDDKNRAMLARRAARLIKALDAKGASLGLDLDKLEEVLEVGRRGAYRWAAAFDGDPELPYEWVGGERGPGAKGRGRLRRIPRCLD